MLVVVNPVTDPDADLLTPWRIARDAELRLHVWDDECVLFHGAAGDTHLVPELVGQMLQILTHAPASVVDLSAAVNLDVADTRSALHDMAALGIAEPVA